eukprot:Nk52_evm43s1020 gene=Nk52_evmTU43s1020
MAISKLQMLQLQILAITWISYASSYVLRKPLSIVKSSLETDLGFSKTQLGYLDSAFLFPYAGAQMVLGNTMDRIGARRCLAVGLWGSALASFSMGWHNAFPIFFALTFLNGVFQAMHWSNCVKGNAPWIDEGSRATVLGIWGTCQSLGGVLGSYIAVKLLEYYGWRSVFFWPSVAVGLFGFVVYLFLWTPSDCGVEPPNAKMRTKSFIESNTTVSFMEVLDIPNLKSVVVSFFCVKLTRYALMLWLPMYFKEELHYSLGEAGMMATTFEIGGAIGSPFTGVLVDRLFAGQKYYATSVFLLLSGGFLWLFTLTGGMGFFVNTILMICVGIFSCGPDSLITGPITLDLAEASGSKNSQATVAGTINGLGGLGSVFQGPLIGIVTSVFAWKGALNVIVALTVGSGVLLFPIAARERRGSLYAKLPTSAS